MAKNMETLKEGAVAKKKFNFGALSSIAGLAALFIVACILSPNFLTFTNLMNVLRQAPILGFVSLGVTLVILTGNNDLSVGGTASFAAVLTAVLLNTGMNPFLVMLVVIICGAIIGSVNGILLSVWDIEAFVITLGMQTFASGLAYLLSEGKIILVNDIPPVIQALANGEFFNIPISFIVLAIFYVLVWLWTKKTTIGRYIFALGGSEEVCYISGVNVNFIRILVYVLSGAFTGLAGVFIFSRVLCGDPTSGMQQTNFAIAAVIVGGTKFKGGRGSVAFTMIGVFIIGIINNLLNLMGAPYYMQLMVQGAVIIAAVVLASSRRGK